MITSETAMMRGYPAANNKNATALKRSDKAIDYTMRTIIILITIMASCTMLLQVISRYVFEVAISGLDEITGHTAVWLYLMGAAYGSYDRSQIKAEMVHLVIKNQPILYSIRALSTIIGAVVAGYMVTWSYGYVRWSILKHEVTPTLQTPTVIFQIAILIGAILMVYYFIREALDLLRQAFGSKRASE
ncbi:MAG: TRAP transporter small permease [Desulfobacteraceae bacterium]|jgi:TRAP-type C4-dicarboxylate transport system permease small subunit